MFESVEADIGEMASRDGRGRPRTERLELVPATSDAEVIALAEAVCPSVNGASAQRLAALMIEARAVHLGDYQYSDQSDADWIASGLSASSSRVQHWSEQLAATAREGAQLTRIDSLDYPSILRMIHNAPPFLFVRGRLEGADNRAIAIVGSRQAGAEGRRIAYDLAAELSSQQITIVSGMAEGIDTAAHGGAIDAGGRTVAVFGTGIRKLYPRANRDLASRIAQAGACVSQFLPGQGPTKWSFPVRNIVTSGLTVGTVVVEAGETSGAKLQAHDALRHGKRLFMVEHLVEQQAWARELLDHPGVVASATVSGIADVVSQDIFGPVDSGDLSSAM